jgi:hypothetical protein
MAAAIPCFELISPHRDQKARPMGLFAIKKTQNPRSASPEKSEDLTTQNS